MAMFLRKPMADGGRSPHLLPPSNPSWLRGLGWLSLAAVLLVPLGAGAWAVRNLTQLPDLPTCWATSLGTAPASTQLYCAEGHAKKGDVEGYRQAIALASRIPQDDPIRANGDRLMQYWAEQILRQAEAAFQQGNLTQAVDIAKQIPASARVRAEAVTKIEEWETTWQTAESIYDRAVSLIDAENWHGTLMAGRELLGLNNQYWATTRYQNLMQQLQTARDSAKQANAEKKPDTTAPRTVDDMIARWEQEQVAEDDTRLQQATQLADNGTPDGLRAAIAEAQQILYGTARYEQAQQFITQWRQQLETIEDSPYLDRAVQLADEGNYRDAINEASNIGWGRSLYDESRQRIDTWREQANQRSTTAPNPAITVPAATDPSPYAPIVVPPSASSSGEALVLPIVPGAAAGSESQSQSDDVTPAQPGSAPSSEN
ncbi:MAG: hypothetical protein KME20_23605 [Kaiparowitsia implicata GSE-PSE-MK54-09C]|nr:hypothetical protein [Kaiparowitsia implicata GSE-PSE-MK54-09C]